MFRPKPSAPPSTEEMPAVASTPTTRDDYLAMLAGAIVDATKRSPPPRRATGEHQANLRSLASPAPSFEPRSWRVFCISDLHADIPTNMRWVEALPSFPPRSALIVAGDVATANAVTRRALLLLKERFEEIFWVPGNHELWLPAANPKTGHNDATLRGYPDDSLGKLLSLIDLCVECGVRVGPTTLPGTPGTSDGGGTDATSVKKKKKGTADVVVVPVLGWYDDAFAEKLRASANNDGPPSGRSSRDAYAHYTEVERDFDAGCKWPACVGTPGRPRDSHADGIASFFRDVNTTVWADAACRVPKDEGVDVLTFSHFVPLARVYLGTARMARVMGSEGIGAQALGIGSVAHVFGHSHVNADDVVDVPDSSRGVPISDWAPYETVRRCRFVQNALGYPHERWGNGGAPKQVWPRDASTSAEGKCATS